MKTFKHLDVNMVKPVGINKLLIKQMRKNQMDLKDTTAKKILKPVLKSPNLRLMNSVDN